MEYSSIIFGIALDKLRYDDISRFFEVERIESDTVEFKAFGGNLENGFQGVIRSVCAFLNSKGGILVWGAPTGNKLSGRTEKSYVGELSPITTVIEKDMVTSKIADSIIPLPGAVRLKVLENGGGEYVCVFEVDESEYSPHQTKGTYFMRIDGQTKPAPHHYIEALFKRVRYPNLEGFLRINNVQTKQMLNGLQVNFTAFFLNWSEILNVEDLSFRIVSDMGEFLAYSTSQVRRISVHKVLHFGQPYTESFGLIVNRQVLAEREYKLKLFLFFGARNTPSKISEYELILWQANPRVDGETYVTGRKENVLFKDHQDSMGVTKEKTLQRLLGRQ